jgi:hypothetical protein
LSWPGFQTFYAPVAGGKLVSWFNTLAAAARLIPCSGVSGSLPDELGGLTNSKTSLLTNHSLTGSTLSELGFMTSMTVTILINNSLTGFMPIELG